MCVSGDPQHPTQMMPSVSGPGDASALCVMCQGRHIDTARNVPGASLVSGALNFYFNVTILFNVASLLLCYTGCCRPQAAMMGPAGTYTSVSETLRKLSCHSIGSMMGD